MDPQKTLTSVKMKSHYDSDSDDLLEEFYKTLINRIVVNIEFPDTNIVYFINYVFDLVSCAVTVIVLTRIANSKKQLSYLLIADC